jgi:hypothetical protein
MKILYKINKYLDKYTKLELIFIMFMLVCLIVSLQIVINNFK